MSETTRGNPHKLLLDFKTRFRGGVTQGKAALQVARDRLQGMADQILSGGDVKKQLEHEAAGLQKIMDLIDDAELLRWCEQISRAGAMIAERKKVGAWQGVIECPECGKELHWRADRSNGHVRAACGTKDCLQWIE